MAKQDRKPKTETVSQEDAKNLSQETGSVADTQKDSKVVLQATRNTNLPDGTFVGEGTEVDVASSYAEKVLKEANTPFVLITK